MTIYVVTNTVNGKVYIGKTVRKVHVRWNRHLGDARNGSETALHRAIRKYGGTSFSVDTLLDGIDDKDTLSRMERRMISLYDTTNQVIGYNLTDGGDGTSGRPMNDRTKQALIKSRLGSKHTADALRRMSESQKGKHKGPFTADHIANMCKAQKGRTVSPEAREKLRRANLGKKQTPEWIALMKERMAGDKNPMSKKSMAAREVAVEEQELQLA